MKKLFSLTLVAMLILSLFAIPSFAAGTGSITINNVAHEDAVYELYKILDLKGFNTSTGAYSYKVNTTWEAFFATADAMSYVTVDSQGFVTWKTGVATDPDTVGEFAKKALAWAEANSITPEKSSKNPADFTLTGTTGKFANLELGYYLIDSDIGILCGLTTTNNDAVIEAKNKIPTITKQVQEDSTTNWGEYNTADIGQTVNYVATIKVHEGAQNYVMHDHMSEGLTFDKVDHITHFNPDTNVTKTLTEGVEYTVHTDACTFKTHDGVGHACTFRVVFSEAFCNSLETNDNVFVNYSAVLNEKAIVGGNVTDVNGGNPNVVALQYGEDHITEWDKVRTYTWSFDLVKTDDTGMMLDGAEFKLYTEATGGSEIKLVWDATANAYRPVTDGSAGTAIVVKNGHVRVVGLDNGHYFLEETKHPEGYNPLSARQGFFITDANVDASFNADSSYSSGGVQVINNSGKVLPSTGGLGTTLFIALGGIAVLASGVLLFAKKRMSQIAE